MFSGGTGGAKKQIGLPTIRACRTAGWDHGWARKHGQGADEGLRAAQVMNSVARIIAA
jgi:hypothetical protein